MSHGIQKIRLTLPLLMVQGSKESAREIGAVLGRGKRQQLSYWLHLGVGYTLMLRADETVDHVPASALSIEGSDCITLNVVAPTTSQVNQAEIIRNSSHFILCGRYLENTFAFMELRSFLLKAELD